MENQIKHAKIIGWGLLTVITSITLLVMEVLEESDSIMPILGIAMYVFMVWGGIVLIKHGSKK